MVDESALKTDAIAQVQALRGKLDAAAAEPVLWHGGRLFPTGAYERLLGAHAAALAVATALGDAVETIADPRELPPPVRGALVAFSAAVHAATATACEALRAVHAETRHKSPTMGSPFPRLIARLSSPAASWRAIGSTKERVAVEQELALRAVEGTSGGSSSGRCAGKDAGDRGSKSGGTAGAVTQPAKGQWAIAERRCSAPLISLPHQTEAHLRRQRNHLLRVALANDHPPASQETIIGWMAVGFLCGELAAELSAIGSAIRDIMAVESPLFS